MKNVLIVTQSFPPTANIAAQRFGTMVDHLSEHGWRPYVLTTESANGGSRSAIPPNQVIRIGAHPHSAQSIGPGSNSERTGPFLRLGKLAQRFVRFRLFSLDRTFFTWYRRIVRSWRCVAPSAPLDAVVASYGPPAALWIGRRLARQYRVPWIVDFRDLGAARRKREPGLLPLLDRAIEKRLVRSASCITSVSPSLCRWLRDTYRKPSFVIYNGFAEAIRATSYLAKSDSPPFLYYAGRFYEHQLTSVFLLFSALQSLPVVVLKVRSLGPVHLERRILDKAQALGVGNRVQLLPPTDQENVEFERAAALANVVVEDFSTACSWAAGTLTGKFLQLLPHRPPIVAIARPDSDIGTILKRTEKGRLCSTVPQVVETIREALMNSEFGRGNEEIEEFGKLRQAQVLCALLDGAHDRVDALCGRPAPHS